MSWFFRTKQPDGLQGPLTTQPRHWKGQKPEAQAPGQSSPNTSLNGLLGYTEKKTCLLHPSCTKVNRVLG